MKTPTARANAIGLMVALPSGHEGREDAEHDQRGRDDDAGGGDEALLDRLVRAAVVGVVLADPRDEEDLVVHREPEQHAHEDDRQEADDAADVRDVEQGRAVPLLEDEGGGPKAAPTDSR